MGSLGDHDDENQPSKRNSVLELSDDETQPFDSQSSATGEEYEGEDFDELQFLQSTSPFVDTVPHEDAFETQVMNFAGETQVLDDPDVDNAGTQLLDDSDNEVFVDTAAVENVGTQLLHESDNDVVVGTAVVENVDTQLLDESDIEVVDTDGEETDRMEILCDTEELSDDDSVKSVGSYPAEKENKRYTSTGKQDDPGSKAESDGLSNEQHCSGSVRVDFTSVRAAALRASGLAARNKASMGTNGESCSIKSDGGFTKQFTAEDDAVAVIRDASTVGDEVDEEEFSGDYNGQMKGLRSSTVRRLFTEDTLDELKEPDACMNNADEGADLPQFPACENEMAGLSYVDSQEPGELSQANAIDFVDKYIKSNVMDFDKEVELGRSTGGKSKPVSITKGTQSLVKRNNLKITAGERGTFDWDDSREDEGGGEFFNKKKEALLDSGGQGQKSLARKIRHLSTKRLGAVDDTRDTEERPEIHQKLKGLVISKAKRSKKTEKATNSKSKKNLDKELSEQLNICSSDRMEATCTDKDMPDMLNVGFDTQMAAEAMEALCCGLDGADHDSKDTDSGANNMFEGSSRGEKKKRSQSKKACIQKLPSSGVINRNSKQTKSTGSKLRKKSMVSSRKQAKKRKECETEVVEEELKKAKSTAEGSFATNQIESTRKVSSEVIEQIEEDRVQKRNCTDDIDRCHVVASPSGGLSVKKRRLQEQLGTFTPIAHRTRQCRISNQLKAGVASSDSGERIHRTEAVVLNDRIRGTITGSDALKTSSKDKISQLGSTEFGELEQEQSHRMLNDTAAAVRFGTLSYNRGKRTYRKSSTKFTGSGDLPGSVNQSVGRGTNGQSVEIKRSKVKGVSTSVDLGIKRKAPSSSTQLEVSPGDRCKPSGSASTTPLNRTTPINAASPICMGDEYFKQSCRKNLSRSFLAKEINSLISNGPEPTPSMKDSRRRRDMASVQVLFSHHLDEDIIKQQKKILSRLGSSEASYISEATHFVTDKFVRTRNMLEAIAFGKPVVTHLWLESCGQASCFIDERNYILRDAKKEKEFGFSLPVSLARASQRPLLQGQKVLITRNTKPGKEILASLVKAVHGLAVDRIGRSAFKGDEVPDDLLLLSCEEDYAICVPFLEKGAAVYSSELLLNGIVTQKLEFERHRLFADHVKKTRSTIWLKQDSNQYLPVNKRK